MTGRPAYFDNAGRVPFPSYVQPNTVRVGTGLVGLNEFTSISSAITFAAAQSPTAANPWTVEVYPGIYTGALTMSDYVNLIGIGPRGSVIVALATGTAVTLATSDIENITVRLTAISGGSIYFYATAAVTSRIFNCVAESTTPGALAHYILQVETASTITIEQCYCSIGGTGSSTLVRSITNAATIRLKDNDFTLNTVNGWLFWVRAAAVITSFRNRYAGTCKGFNNVTAQSTFTFDHDDILTTGVFDSPYGTHSFNHCRIVPIVAAGNTATMRIKNSAYRTISRSGTGNIVDESPQFLDSIFHLASYIGDVKIASANIATRTSVGTVTDGGNGQCVLRAAAVGYAGIENPADATGGLATTFNPARTPRFAVQFSEDSFPANCTMFLGLRATLGNAVPAMNEIHAGFRWDGTNFIASSSNGGGVGVADNCTTPSTGAQHQLEVIILGGIQVEFYIDGALVFTHATAAGLPSGEMNWQVLLITAAIQTVDLSVRRLSVQECPA